ncbi:MAG: LuxR C-terminal-related transcriptional regulator, partial [Gammaproteobacteria bacterium]|nr:LuxR C-terminal-related transcriptional regulator [Gammaproteobacteria bacterium]
VLDVRMAHMSGIALQRRLNELGCRLPIVFVSGHGDIDTAVSAVKMGAVDFIQKPYHEHGLLDSINEALTLGAVQTSNNEQSTTMESRIASLTAREREVMQLLLQGLTNKHVARSLNISPRTVEVHRRHVLEKCGVKSVTELLAQLGSNPAIK